VEMKSIFVLLQLLGVAGIAFGNSYLAEFETARKRFEAKETLSYGLACNYEDEEKRLKFNAELHRLMSGITSVTAFSTAARSMTEVTNSVEALCSPKQNLQCNKGTSTCDCVQPNPDLPVNITAVRDGNACKLSSGSTCLPPEKGKVDECKSGTRCIMEESKVNCDYNTISQSFLAGGRYASFDFLNIFKTNYNALASGICKCL